MDPERSPDPRVFNPGRFKGDLNSLYQSTVGAAKTRDNYLFGSGRRLCQGIHIAERSLFLGISRFLWAFNFSPAKGVDGTPVSYDVEDLVGGITVQPAEYPAVIEPRSADKVRMIRENVKECQDLLDPVTGQWKTVPEGMAFSTWMPEKVEA